jgi:hypothetical protein
MLFMEQIPSLLMGWVLDGSMAQLLLWPLSTASTLPGTSGQTVMSLPVALLFRLNSGVSHLELFGKPCHAFQLRHTILSCSARAIKYKNHSMTHSIPCTYCK